MGKVLKVREVGEPILNSKSIMKDIWYVKIIWIIYPNQAIFFDAIRH